MKTSALDFQQLMTAASSSKNPKDRFLTVLANHLSLNGVDAEGKVVIILVKKISAIYDDIDKLAIDEQMKSQLLGYMVPFQPVRDLQHVFMTIEAAKQNFLKPVNLVGLMNVHFALMGSVEYDTIDKKEAETLADNFRKIAKEIKDEELPPSIKEALLKRTLQMSSILDHYYAFEPDDLRETIEGLVGAIHVNSPSSDKNAAKLFIKLAKLTVCGLGILTAVDTGLSNILSISENGKKLIELAEGTSEDG